MKTACKLYQRMLLLLLLFKNQRFITPYIDPCLVYSFLLHFIVFFFFHTEMFIYFWWHLCLTMMLCMCLRLLRSAVLCNKNNRRCKHARKTEAELTVKHGDGSVTVCHCFAASWYSELFWEACVYCWSTHSFLINCLILVRVAVEPEPVLGTLGIVCE